MVRPALAGVNTTGAGEARTSIAPRGRHVGVGDELAGKDAPSSRPLVEFMLPTPALPTVHPLSLAKYDWSTLVNAARRWPVLNPFGDAVADDELRLLLKTPVAVAWWITTFAPALAQRERLDLLMVGLPGGPSAADEGRPYQLLPLLLDRPQLQVSATVILWTHESRFAPPIGYLTPRISLAAHDGVEAIPATMFAGSLTEWLARRCGHPPDLCLLVHPGFDERVPFWAGVRHLLEAGTHVGCLARGPEKVERDAWLLQAYGYDVTPDAKPNPWARYHPELRGHGAWGAVGWRLQPHSIPPPDFAIDTARLQRAYDAQLFLQHEFELWNPLPFIGQVQVVAGDPSADPERFVGLPDHHAVSLQTGEIWALEPEGRVPAAGNISLAPEVRATFPGEHAHSFERVLWAVEVYDEQFRRREAAAMPVVDAKHAEQVRERVERFLQGKVSQEEVDAFTEYYRGGMQPSTATPGSETLFGALRRRDWNKAAALTAESPWLVNARCEEGRTPLFYAMNARHYELARRWLERGAEPNHLDYEGFAAIHDAAKRDDTTAVELLHRNGADLDLGTGLGFTPALLALRYGCWTVLAYLLAQGVDLRKTAIAGAAVEDQYESIAGLPRVLRSEIERQLGRRRIIPIAVLAPAA